MKRAPDENVFLPGARLPVFTIEKIYLRRCKNMSNSSNSNKMTVPEAKEAMNRFKQEVASELGVPLKEGYNGDLTSRQAGSIGGEMVKKMIMKQEEQMSGK